MKHAVEQQPASDMELFRHANSVRRVDSDTKRVVPGLPQAPFAAHSETSKAAAESQTDSNRLLDMARIFNLVRSRADGCTCDEAEQVLGLTHQTASARISEMSDPERNLPLQLIQSGMKRKTRSGRLANVYMCRPEQF